VLGVLLAALAVQYMLDGLLSVLQLPPAQAFGINTELPNCNDSGGHCSRGTGMC
jgi:hypothetical protein